MSGIDVEWKLEYRPLYGRKNICLTFLQVSEIWTNFVSSPSVSFDTRLFALIDRGTGEVISFTGSKVMCRLEFHQNTSSDPGCRLKSQMT